MKNSFNNHQASCGAVCSLCQDTLLRHISQSRMFWYCPSCRQEMVCEEPEKPVKSAVNTHVGQRTQQRNPKPIATNYDKPVGMRAS